MRKIKYMLTFWKIIYHQISYTINIIHLQKYREWWELPGRDVRYSPDSLSVTHHREPASSGHEAVFIYIHVHKRVPNSSPLSIMKMYWLLCIQATVNLSFRSGALSSISTEVFLCFLYQFYRANNDWCCLPIDLEIDHPQVMISCITWHKLIRENLNAWFLYCQGLV